MSVSMGVVLSLLHPWTSLCLPNTHYGPIRMKFGICSLSDKERINNCICVAVGVVWY